MKTYCMSEHIDIIFKWKVKMKIIKYLFRGVILAFFLIVDGFVIIYRALIMNLVRIQFVYFWVHFIMEIVLVVFRRSFWVYLRIS